MQNERLSFKDFVNKVVNGAARGIVVGLIPNAIFGEIFKALSHIEFFAALGALVGAFQFTVAFLVGLFVALEFEFNANQSAAIIGAAFLGSGMAQLVDGAWVLQGTGDLINTMLTVGIAAFLIRLYGNRLPNIGIIMIPLVGGVIPGFIGTLTLPHVKKLTGLLGSLIENFTNLQPMLMMILIAIAFALIIVTPLSTVAIAYAISLSGLGAGAANVGIAATVFTLVYGSSKVNHPGTTVALFFAGPKMFMSNFLNSLVMALPITINAAVTGLVAYFLKIHGTTASAGFGITGLAGPINAFAFMEGSTISKVLILIIQYVIVPLGSAAITHTIFTKAGLYTNDIYKLETGE